MAGPRLKLDEAGNPMSPGKWNTMHADLKKCGRKFISKKYIENAREDKVKHVQRYLTRRLHRFGIDEIDTLTGEHANWGGRHVYPRALTVIKRHGVKVASIAGYDIYSMYEPLKLDAVAQQFAPYVRGAFLRSLKKRKDYYLTIKVLAPAA